MSMTATGAACRTAETGSLEYCGPVMDTCRRPALGDLAGWGGGSCDGCNALPRPERLGFVIKNVCAENCSSLSTVRRNVPSGIMSQLCAVSLIVATMICSTICLLTVLFSIGTSTSTRPFRLRGIQSAEDTKTLASVEGKPWPSPTQTIRPCSRYRPTTLFTRMLSESPGTPARRQHMPRTIRSILTPARLAA